MDYIKINGKKIKLTEEQIKEIQQSFVNESLKLADISAGDTFKIGKYEFVVLEQFEDRTAVILKDLLFESKQFGKSNNYNESFVDEICNDFGNEIASIISNENLIEHTVDLTSDDGLKDYCSIQRKMSLLTANQYRKYVEILDKYKLKKWWWLVTAYSTPSHDDSTWVKCVSPVGCINGDDYIDDNGVRPFCILKSNIFVSK